MTPDPAEPRTDARLIHAVRLAKAEKLARCGVSDLTPAELDALLATVECRRTRERLGITAQAKGARP